MRRRTSLLNMGSNAEDEQSLADDEHRSYVSRPFLRVIFSRNELSQSNLHLVPVAVQGEGSHKTRQSRRGRRRRQQGVAWHRWGMVTP